VPHREVLIIKNLRDFISELERSGELLCIKNEVDWKYEIGDRTRQAQTSYLKPALLFENIKDYPGFKVFTNGLCNYSKIAVALGLAPLTSIKDIVKVFKQRISYPIESVIVNYGAFQENIFIGNDVDLTKLPVPWWSREDVGRYIGTWHLNITKDPETKVRNVGIYRMQLLSPKQTAISFSPHSDIALHVSKAEERAKPLEMAVAIGIDETLIMAAAAAFPYGTDEYYLAGGLNQEATALTRCRTVDLEVPASAEIIIEGKILPGMRVKEGPFFDYSGVPNSNPSASVFEVSCIMYRDNPVFRGATIGIPGGEDHLLFTLLSCADCLDFHGSRIRQKIQNAFLKKGMFKTFQKVGQFRRFLKLIKRLIIS
jgi:UbiD family decarboxylase